MGALTVDDRSASASIVRKYYVHLGCQLSKELAHSPYDPCRTRAHLLVTVSFSLSLSDSVAMATMNLGLELRSHEAKEKKEASVAEESEG